MYAAIIQKVDYTKTSTKKVSTPIGFGPFSSQGEAVGSAVEYLRSCGYNDSFFFDDYDPGNVRIEITNSQTGNRNLVACVLKLGEVK